MPTLARVEVFGESLQFQAKNCILGRENPLYKIQEPDGCRPAPERNLGKDIPIVYSASARALASAIAFSCAAAGHSS